MADILRAITSFEVMSRADGLPRMFNPGSLVYSNDCDVKGREENFEPVEVAAARTARGVDTETASAAPGERRFRSKPTGPAAPKAADDHTGDKPKESGN